MKTYVQIADTRSWDFSASIIVEAKCAYTHTHTLDNSSVSLENPDIHPNLRVITLTITVLNISGKINGSQPRLNKQSQLYVS